FYNALIVAGAHDGDVKSLRQELAAAVLNSKELPEAGYSAERIARAALEILNEGTYAHHGGDLAPQFAPQALRCKLVWHNEDGSTQSHGEDSERQFHLVRVTWPSEHYHAAVRPE